MMPTEGKLHTANMVPQQTRCHICTTIDGNTSGEKVWSQDQLTRNMCGSWCYHRLAWKWCNGWNHHEHWCHFAYQLGNYLEMHSVPTDIEQDRWNAASPDPCRCARICPTNGTKTVALCSLNSSVHWLKSPVLGYASALVSLQLEPNPLFGPLC